MNATQGEYVLVGDDYTSLWLQPGFVEGIVADQKRFSTLEKAYQHIFRRNLEFAIILWNAIPIRLSYQNDLPFMINDIVKMLENVQGPNKVSRASYKFQTPNITALWKVETDTEMVTIDGYWDKIHGCYEASLNQLGTIRMHRLTFLYEWKLLLQQFIVAIADSDAILTKSKAQEQLTSLQNVESKIPIRGSYYQY